MIYKNDITPEILAFSYNNREYAIDWASLKLFAFDGMDKPTALVGKSIHGNLHVTIRSIIEFEKSERPFAIFYKQKKNDVKKIFEIYYLSDDECVRFHSKFSIMH